MPIYYGGKKLQSLYWGGKKISSAWYGGKCVYRSGMAAGTVLWSGNVSINPTINPATGMQIASPAVVNLSKNPALAGNGIKFHFSNVDSIDVSQDGTSGLKTNGTDTVSVPKSLIGKDISFRVTPTGAWDFGISFTVEQGISIYATKYYTYDSVYPILTKVDAY
ncbi:hypothetical protein [Schleiferilactobacillus harbinensis]|uniref:Uncharacterized protein n=1 Tax=Schleiferilactobacillus harbinensis TaxID=304207 RepID=A0ABU7T2V5_9LACO